MDYITFKNAISFASETQGASFVIKTNVARGRGINGVSFESYHERKTWTDINGHENYEYTTIVKISDVHVELEVQRKDDAWNSGVFRYFIPLENIVEIVVKI